MRQLQLEEAVFRVSNASFALVNEAPAYPPSIVLGRSNAVSSNVNLDRARAMKNEMNLIRRFTGGGTVLVDHRSVLTSIIANGVDGSVFPGHLMNWSAGVFKRAIPSLSLQSTDYTVGDMKVAGNAQSISKCRFVVRSLSNGLVLFFLSLSCF